MALTQAQAKKLLNTYRALLEETNEQINTLNGLRWVKPTSTSMGYSKTKDILAGYPNPTAARSAMITRLISTLGKVANNTADEMEIAELMRHKADGEKKAFFDDTVSKFLVLYDAKVQTLLGFSQALSDAEADLENKTKTVQRVARRRTARLKLNKEAQARDLINETIYKHLTLKKETAAKKEAEALDAASTALEDTLQNVEKSESTTKSSSDATFYINCLASITAIGGAAICIAALVTGQPLAVVAVGLALTAIGFMAYRPSYGADENNTEQTLSPNTL